MIHMGLRRIERHLAPELCFLAVETVVEAWIRESQKASRSLLLTSHLRFAILNTGFQPPGLDNMAYLMDRYRERALADEGHVDREQRGRSIPDADYLIEGIMNPYPFRRLRAYWRRVHRRRRAQRTEEMMRREGVQRNAT